MQYENQSRVIHASLNLQVEILIYNFLKLLSTRRSWHKQEY